MTDLNKVYKQLYFESLKVKSNNQASVDKFSNYHKKEILDPEIFNQKFINYLVWHNTKRGHQSFKNKLSSAQFILSIQANNFNLLKKCKIGWTCIPSWIFLGLCYNNYKTLKTKKFICGGFICMIPLLILMFHFLNYIAILFCSSVTVE